jgi:DNA-binding MarR family transcriptional regulator
MDHPATSIDETVEALLAASRSLLAVSVRSVVSTTDITVAQYRMLVVLSENHCNLKALATELDVAASTAMRMVDRLEEAGYVQRQVRPENRRETILLLTEEGREVVLKVTTRRRRDLRRLVEKIPAGERAPLIGAMQLFDGAAQLMEPMAP